MPQFQSNMFTNPSQMGRSSAEWHDQQGLDRGNSFYEMLYNAMSGSGAYGSTQDASARATASGYEDSMLREQLGSSRKKRKGENAPEGSFALAKYPELWKAVEWAKTGNLPGGAGSSEKMWLKEAQDPALRNKNSEQRKNWAHQQAAMLGGRY